MHTKTSGMKLYRPLSPRSGRMNPKRFFYCLLIMLFLSVTAGIPDIYAGDPNPGEYQVKAVFLYNFAKFVEWPADAFVQKSDTMNLCIIGDDPFGSDLNTIQGEVIGNKRLSIKHVGATQPLKECHILFVCKSERKQLSKIVNTLKGASVLLVGDTDGFAQQNIIINFYLEEDKVRFEINADAAKLARLNISSKLLKLAKIVHSGDR
jgi:hypothetical protein